MAGIGPKNLHPTKFFADVVDGGLHFEQLMPICIKFYKVQSSIISSSKKLDRTEMPTNYKMDKYWYYVSTMVYYNEHE